MLWLVTLLVLACLLLYFWIIRPILKHQPMLSAAFKAEASLWEKVQAKLVGFRTKLSARLLAIAGIAVGFHDEILPLVSGQDVIDGKAAGVVVVWPHHVGEIRGGPNARGRWLVHSGNDGNAVRTRWRLLLGAIAFRWVR